MIKFAYDLILEVVPIVNVCLIFSWAFSVFSSLLNRRSK